MMFVMRRTFETRVRPDSEIVDPEASDACRDLNVVAQPRVAKLIMRRSSTVADGLFVRGRWAGNEPGSRFADSCGCRFRLDGIGQRNHLWPGR